MVNKEKISKKQNSITNKLFKPNRKLYCVLFAVSLLITVTCLTIPQSSNWFTIVSGIGCGGIASTIVAWLIDEANSEDDRKRVENNRKILFNRLYLAFDNGLQLLIASLYEHNFDDNTSRNWFEWEEVAYDFKQRDPKRIKDYNLYLRMFFHEVGEQVSVIEAQIAILLEYGIVDPNDIEALALIGSICSLAKQEQSDENIEQVASHYRNYCTAIKLALSYSTNMCYINEKLIEPKILKLIMKRNAENKE